MSKVVNNDDITQVINFLFLSIKVLYKYQDFEELAWEASHVSTMTIDSSGL